MTTIATLPAGTIRSLASATDRVVVGDDGEGFKTDRAKSKNLVSWGGHETRLVRAIHARIHSSMGGSNSTNRVDEYVSELVSICDTATQNCWTEITGTNSIVLDGVSDSTIHDIQQGLILQCDVDCTMSVSSNTNITSQMQAAAQQEADSASSGFGFSSADASNYYNLCMQMTTAVTQNYSQNLQAIGQANNEVVIKNSTNLNVYALYQTATYDAELSGMMSVSSVTAIADQMQSTIDQYAKSKSTSSLAVILVAVAVIVVVALLFVGIFMDLLFNPAFWFLIVSVGLVTSGYFLLAYFPKWWPYKEIYDSDTDDEKADKEAHNKSDLKFWGITTSIIGAIEAAFVAFVMISRAGKQKKQQQQQPQTQPQTQSVGSGAPQTVNAPTAKAV